MQRHTYIVTFLIVFFLTSVVFSQANADEIEDMTETLNQKILEHDWKGFGATFTEFIKKDGRYSSSDAEKAGDSASKTVTSLDTFGEILSHTQIRMDRCGDRIARTVTVFFSKDGQFYIAYWFFKAENNWSTNTITYEGYGSTSTFVKLLTGALSFDC